MKFNSKAAFVVAAISSAHLFLLATGCGHPTVVVSAVNAPPALTSTPTTLPGIPFYVKRGMCKRETVWAEPRYTLQVNVMAGDKPAASRSLVVSRSFLIENTNTKNANSKFAQLLKDLYALAAARKESDLESSPNTPVCPEDVAKEWDTEAQSARDIENNPFCEEITGSPCKSLATGEKDGDLLRMVNTANVVNEVDYEHVYYMNTQTPWIGNASADTTLNTDGTLSKGTIAVNDQTWSTIIGTIGTLAGDVTSFESANVAAKATVTVAHIANPQQLMASNIQIEETNVSACKGAPGWPLPREAAVTAVKAPKIAADIAPKTDARPKAKVKPDPEPTPDNKPALDAGPDSTKTELGVSYQVSIQATVYLHDHVKEDTGLGTACYANATGVTDGSVTITRLDDAKAKDDSGAIKVSGTVTLPKAAATPPQVESVRPLGAPKPSHLPFFWRIPGAGNFS